MMRLPRLTYQQMDARQKQVHDKIVGGSRGRLGTPYSIWIANPELCEAVEALSAYIRWGSSLPEKLSELGILIAARFWDAQFPWNAHVDKAIAAGIDPASIAAMAEKRTPRFSTLEEEVFYRFCVEILERHFVSDDTFEQARAIFGSKGVMDIIACVGNFSLLGMLLNTVQADLQDVPPPFADVRGYGKAES